MLLLPQKNPTPNCITTRNTTKELDKQIERTSESVKLLDILVMTNFQFEKFALAIPLDQQ